MNRFVLFSSALLLACGALALNGCARPLAGNARVVASNVDSLKKAFGGGAAEAGAATAVAAAEPTGWSTVKGQFKLTGAPPVRLALAITKDPQVCAPGGKPVLGEEMVVDSAGGIKDVAIFLTTKLPANNPKWEHPDYAATATAETALPFDQKNCVFLSHLYIMRSTQTVVIKNSDEVGHNTSISPSAGSKAASLNELMPALGSTKYKPIGESIVPNPVACSIHPWMSALILTRNNPYYAVTAADGTFEIKNVPAGVELEFAVWQQKVGFLGKVSVQENGGAAAAQSWKKGRFKKTLTADMPLDLNVTLDAADVPK
ncbi:hypothetical protein [Anatilimnocola floriformis]|uniref:hypothetical protein n=1 Tax=Anatilimnocola floriformis TaxID=2948575 RepID=UPI0020C1FC82|nr:hypothetical protein [Anatilimnocola floriformis]